MTVRQILIQESVLDSLLDLMKREIKARFNPSKWTVEKFIDWLIQKFKDEIPVFATIDDIRVRLRKYMNLLGY